jgi:Tfp pilus assembly major pilin PilA
MQEKYYIYVFMVSFLFLCGLIWIHGRNKNKKSRRYILWAAMVILIIQISITAITFPLVEKYTEAEQKLMDSVEQLPENAYRKFGDLPKKITDLGYKNINMDNPDYNMTTVSGLNTISNMQTVLNQVVDKTAHAVDTKVPK